MRREEAPLPGCLQELLEERLLPKARRDTDAKRFANRVMVMEDVKTALHRNAPELRRWYDLKAGGRPSSDAGRLRWGPPEHHIQGYESPDRALVGAEETTALATALKRREEADPKKRFSGRK